MPRVLSAAASLAAFFFVVTASAFGQSPSNPAPPAPAPTNAAMPFMQLAGESDVYEVTSSEIALMRSQNPEVRAFASMLIDHHTRTTNSVLTQAAAARVAPPPAVLGPQKRAWLDALYTAPAADFDSVYLEQQVPAHEAALALMQRYASSGDTPSLREAARETVPIVESHLERARTLQRGAMR